MCTTSMPIASVSFLMSSPLIKRCMSIVRLFGATYSATAVSMALEMNPEMNGTSMTFGSILLKGTTDMVIRGRPSRVTKVVLTLMVRNESQDRRSVITLRTMEDLR